MPSLSAPLPSLLLRPPGAPLGDSLVPAQVDDPTRVQAAVILEGAQSQSTAQVASIKEGLPASPWLAGKPPRARPRSRRRASSSSKQPRAFQQVECHIFSGFDCKWTRRPLRHPTEPFGASPHRSTRRRLRSRIAPPKGLALWRKAAEAAGAEEKASVDPFINLKLLPFFRRLRFLGPDGFRQQMGQVSGFRFVGRMELLL
jgi:hypothetical protein